MNKTLDALNSKLTWQLNEISQHLQTNAEELTKLQERLDAMQTKIHKGYVIPAIINPEQEIARLNFIVHHQQEQDYLKLEKKELNLRHSQLQERQLRLNSELKMLEKYQEKQQKIEEKTRQALQQHANDEWVLQRRKF